MIAAVRAAAGRIGRVEPLGEELVEPGVAGGALVRQERVELGLQLRSVMLPPP